MAFPFGETETEMGHDDDKDAPDDRGARDEAREENTTKKPLMAWERELLGSFVREWLDAEVLDGQEGGQQ